MKAEETNPENKISVLIVEDHSVVREGLAALIGLEPDIEVVGQAANGQEAVKLFAKLRPQVTLVDLNMPVLDGATAIREIRRLEPNAKTVVLTTFGGDEDIYRALQAGASGYLLKDVMPDVLLDTIRNVYAGKVIISSELMQKLAGRLGGDNLTAREMEILNLIADGKTNQEIADVLFIAESTVKFHINNIFGKLGVADRTKAVVIALKRGLVHL